MPLPYTGRQLRYGNGNGNGNGYFGTECRRVVYFLSSAEEPSPESKSMRVFGEKHARDLT